MKIGPTPVKKLNVSKLADSEMQKVLLAHKDTNTMNISYNGTISNQSETFYEKVYETSIDTLGHTTRKQLEHWFDENDAEILSLLEERRRAHDAKLRYAQAKSKLLAETNLQKDSSLQSIRSMVHRKLLLRQLEMRKVHTCSHRN